MGIYTTSGAPPAHVGGGLPPMAASQPTRMFGWIEYISIV
ncbi:hypothetical protein C4K01_0495 [Pseudomonas synxantha]|nr:hypothetical protein C4K01_0495 [Pseudomonas synxantha]